MKEKRQKSMGEEESWKLGKGKRRFRTGTYWEKHLYLSKKALELQLLKIKMIEEILEMRKVNKMTLEAIGKRFKLTRERIRQILEQLKLND